MLVQIGIPIVVCPVARRQLHLRLRLERLNTKMDLHFDRNVTYLQVCCCFFLFHIAQIYCYVQSFRLTCTWNCQNFQSQRISKIILFFVYFNSVNCQQNMQLSQPEHQPIHHPQIEKQNIYNTSTVFSAPSGVSRENQNIHLEKLADISLPEKRTNLKSNDPAHDVPHNNSIMLSKGHTGVNKPTIKSEYAIKAEKSVPKSPSQSASSQLSQQIQQQKIDAYNDQTLNINANQSKTLCETTNQPIQNVNISQSQSPCMSTQLSMQQAQMGGYIGSENPQHTHQRSAFESTNGMLSNHMSIEDQYIREQQIRYSQQMSEMNTIARPTVSYPSELVSNRASYELSSRSYDPSSIPTSTAFERYDPSCIPQRANMYPYMQPTIEDINNQQKYLHEQQQMAQAMMKAEQEENSAPIYPRPMYHYDPSAGPLPPGFSAINLSVKVGSIQSGFKGTVSSPGVPVIDLSTSSVTSSSPHGFHSQNFPIQRIASPSSPHLASPQVPSPQGQTLDLSVSRIPHW